MKRVLCMLLLVCLLSALGCADKSGGTQTPLAMPDRDTATYAVLVGSTSEKIVDERFPKAAKLPFDSVNDAVLALLSGKADYVITAYTTCLSYMSAHPDALAMLPEKLSDEPAAIAVQKGETELLADIDRVLAQFREDGTLEQIIGNWIREDGSDYVRSDIPVLADGAVLDVAVSAEREPMCYVEDGQIVGLDAELIQRIAFELGMRVVFHDMKFSAIIPSVLSGKTPVATSNITATDERRESVSFTSSYFVNPQMLLTRAAFASSAAEAPDHTTLAGLAGQRIGVTTGSLCDQYALAEWPDAKLQYHDGAPNLVVALQQGKIDAFLVDEPVARQVTLTTDGLAIVPEPVTQDQYGFAFQRDAEGAKLRDAFNAFLHDAEAEGLLDELDALWFGSDEAKKTIEAAGSLPAVNGVIRFASTMEAPPFNYLSDGQPIGLEVDLITRFCKQMGYGLDIQTASFGALLPGLVSDYYDVVASSITITEERAESVHFSEPFYLGGVVAVVSVAAEPDASLPDPHTARIGSMTGTICETLAIEHYPEAEYSSFTGVGDMMAALKIGKLDYCSMPEIDAVNYTRSDPGYALAPGILAASNSSIAVAKGNEELVGQLNTLLDAYDANGTLERLMDNWIRPDGSDYIMDEVPRLTEGPELRLAFCSGLEPSCFVIDGEATGMDIELAYRLAYDLGYRLTLSDMSFSALIAALESGRADLAISGIAATEERAEKVDFTRSYYDTPIVLVYYNAAEAEQTGFFASLANSFRKNFLVENRWKLIASGIGVTLLLSVCAGIAGILIGFGFCLMRMSRGRVPGVVASVITRILQGTPMVVLLMILYYIVFNKAGLDGISVAIIAFGLNFGAYASEIMLSGIRAVDNGQREAAAAMGFTPAATFLKIVFPQAARHFLPVLKGEYISLVKMTSIVGYVAVQDLTKVSDIIRSRTYEAFFPLIVTAVIYFLLSLGLSSLLKLVEIRIDPKHRPRTLKGVKL